MVVRMKHTKGKRNRVRSHHALSKRRFSVCAHCKADSVPHTVCMNCGYYGGRKIIDVLKKEAKKNKKKIKKETKEEKETSEHKR